MSLAGCCAIVVGWLALQAGAPPRDVRPGPATGSGVIRGVVLDQATGAPIAGALVSVSTFIQPDTTPISEGFRSEAIADAEGRFELTQLPAGPLVVSAHPGEHRSAYLQTTVGHDRAASPFLQKPSLELAPGEVREGLRIALTRALAIEGRVLNEHGEPMADVRMTAVPLDGIGGSNGDVHTDDRGRYRLYGFSPGRYRVCASVAVIEVWTAVGPVVGEGLRERYDRTCVTSPPLSLRGEPPFVILQLQRTAAFTLSGTVTSSTGSSVREARITARRSEPRDQNELSAVVRGGRFVIHGLLPGDYTVRAWLEVPVAGGVRQESAYLAIRIDGDVDDVALTTAPPASVEGRVVASPSATGALPPVISIRALQPLDVRDFSPEVSAMAEVDGAFTLNRLSARLIIAVQNLPRGWVVEAVKYGGEDITDRAREFRHGDTRRIEVVLTDRTAELHARPVDADGKLRSDAIVMLLRPEPERWAAANLWGSPTRSKDGVFEFTRAAGEYLVLALPLQDALRAMNEGGRTLAALAERARRVTLTHGTPLTIDVTVTRIDADR